MTQLHWFNVPKPVRYTSWLSWFAGVWRTKIIATSTKDNLDKLQRIIIKKYCKMPTDRSSRLI